MMCFNLFGGITVSTNNRRLNSMLDGNIRSSKLKLNVGREFSNNHAWLHLQGEERGFDHYTLH